MKTTDKDTLISEWKKLRFEYFNTLGENREKFEDKYSNHPLYESVIKYLDKSFRDINQIAEIEINRYLSRI